MPIDKKWLIREGLLINKIEAIIHTPTFLASITSDNVLELMPYFTYLALSRQVVTSEKIAVSQGSIAESMSKVTALQLAPDVTITDRLSAQTQGLYTAFTQLSTLLAQTNTRITGNETLSATEFASISSDFMEIKAAFDIIAENFVKTEETFQILKAQDILK